jgi:chorismate mutase/prephenate dehydratase
MNDLELLRNQINEVDEELIELFLKRLKIVSQVGEYKKRKGLQILDTAREKQIIDKYTDKAENDTEKKYVREFLENLMSISRKVQGEICLSGSTVKYSGLSRDYCGFRVGYQGVKGCFSHQACFEYFGESTEAVSLESFKDIFDAIQKEEIKYGVLPIENSSSGSITEVYDLIRQYNFFILGEKCLKIEHNLMGVKGAQISDIKEVYSHYQGFLQCGRFLTDMPDVKTIPHFDTAGSAEYVSGIGDKTKACIAGKNAARIYGLDILKENIQSFNNNHTRFIIIGKELEVDRDADKISVIISIPHKSGALYDILKYFADHKSNMQKIESRPMDGEPWQYFFYIDFSGNIEEKNTKELLGCIERGSLYYRFLGNYRNGADCR